MKKLNVGSLHLSLAAYRTTLKIYIFLAVAILTEILAEENQCVQFLGFVHVNKWSDPKWMDSWNRTERLALRTLYLKEGDYCSLPLCGSWDWVIISGWSPLGAFLEHVFVWFYPFFNLWACSAIAPTVVNENDSPQKYTLDPSCSVLCRRYYTRWLMWSTWFLVGVWL